MKLTSVYGVFALACLGATYALHHNKGRALDLVNGTASHATAIATRAAPDNATVPAWFQESDVEPVASSNSEGPISSRSTAQVADTTRGMPMALPPFHDVSQAYRVSGDPTQ